MWMKTIEWSSGVNIEIRMTGDLYCLCPVNGRQDHAFVEVVYTPSSALLELGSFRDHLATYATQEILHERATVGLFMELSGDVVPRSLSVRTTWDAVEGIPCVVTCST